jgi:hypothetical protein
VATAAAQANKPIKNAGAYHCSGVLLFQFKIGLGVK